MNRGSTPGSLRVRSLVLAAEDQCRLSVWRPFAEVSPCFLNTVNSFGDLENLPIHFDRLGRASLPRKIMDALVTSLH